MTAYEVITDNVAEFIDIRSDDYRIILRQQGKPYRNSVMNTTILNSREAKRVMNFIDESIKEGEC